MNWRVISRNVGYALLVSALFMFFSIIVSVLNGNDSALAALIISFTTTFVFGLFPFIFVRKAPAISLKEGYVIITLSWLLSFVFGMLPYALWGGPFSIQNAWFESVSGFTTTGATILDNVEALPKSLLFWRSSTHFIGGLGVVVFLLLIIPGSSPMKMRLTNMELSALTKGSLSIRADKIVYAFAYVYLAIGVLAFLAYALAGMPLFDAICNAMSLCSTGGFCTRNSSFAAFDSRLIEGITMVFMYLGSINFGLLFMAVAGKSFKAFDNPVLKFYTSSVILFSLILATGLKSKGICAGWGESLWNGLFQVLCVSSTTGFAILDNSTWPLSVNSLTLCIAIMCGCSGSTSGGLKADRVLLLFKSIGCRIGKILHPTLVNEVKLGRKFFRDAEVAPHLLYIGMYALLLLISMMLAFIVGINDENAFVASVSCLGNVGPAIGAFGTMGSFNSAPALAKIIFSLDMFIGRIEIYPVLAVVAMLFDRRRN
ncbi:MAG: TrkH family potassium uptake protein [Bacteroidales bacterium]|nr:TrkH family potassium uptake protein [Bacteroidales bacterium]